MITILKHEIKLGGITPYRLPIDAIAMCAAVQDDKIFVWVKQDTEAKKFKTTGFHIFGTGWEIDDNEHLEHVDTIHHNGFVWHIFVEKWDAD